MLSNCSEETKTQLDSEIIKVLKEAHDKAEKMLKIIKLMPLLKENGLFM